MIPKLITTDGKITEFLPANGTDFTLEELQKVVGGYIEVLYPPSEAGAILVINENGKFEDLPVNALATEIWLETVPNWPDHIVGPAVLMHKSQLK